MKYPTLDRGPAEEALIRLEREQPLSETRVVWKGTGATFAVDAATELIDRLVDLRRGSERDRASDWGHRFDAQAAAIVHEWASDHSVPPRMIADQGFWRWLALIHGYEIIKWRYDDEKGNPLKRENFGLKGTRENALFRMYQIGAIVHEPDAREPYALARAGDVDFWRSHILRQNYANARPVARVLARLQSNQIEGHPKLKISAIRELAKDLRRLRANIVFECLTEDGAERLIKERIPYAIERAKATQQKKVTTKEDPNGADPAGVQEGTD